MAPNPGALPSMACIAQICTSVHGAVESTNPLVSGIGQIDDLAIWSRALAPPEVLRVLAEGISESDSNLSLFYDFNEGTGSFARNKGRAGDQYDLVLGRSDAGGPTAYHVANKFGGFDQKPFTQPVWAALPVSAGGADNRCIALVGKPQPTGFGGKLSVTVKESSFTQFVLEYFHPAGRKANVRISRPPMHGRLEQVLCAGINCSRSLVSSVPFDVSSSAYSSLVRCCDYLASIHSMLPTDCQSAAVTGLYAQRRLFQRRRPFVLGLRKRQRVIGAGAVRVQVLESGCRAACE